MNGEELVTRFTRLAQALALVALVAAPATAHHPAHIEEALAEREPAFRALERPAPDIALIDADGRPVALSDFHDVLVVHVVPTGCGEPCRRQAELVAEVEAMVSQTPMADLVRFLGVITDAEGDEQLGAVRDAASWPLLTVAPDAPMEAVRQLTTDLGHDERQGGGGEEIAVGVIDPQGRWRGTFHGFSFEPANLVLFVNALVQETQ
jgi:protein SCO1